MPCSEHVDLGAGSRFPARAPAPSAAEYTTRNHKQTSTMHLKRYMQDAESPRQCRLRRQGGRRPRCGGHHGGNAGLLWASRSRPQRAGGAGLRVRGSELRPALLGTCSCYPALHTAPLPALIRTPPPLHGFLMRGLIAGWTSMRLRSVVGDVV